MLLTEPRKWGMREHIDESVLSRGSSYDALGSFVAMPVGQLTCGSLAVAFGTREVMVVAGVAFGVLSPATLLSRSVRSLEHVSTAETAVEAEAVRP